MPYDKSGHDMPWRLRRPVRRGLRSCAGQLFQPGPTHALGFGSDEQRELLGVRESQQPCVTSSTRRTKFGPTFDGSVFGRRHHLAGHLTEVRLLSSGRVVLRSGRDPHPVRL